MSHLSENPINLKRFSHIFGRVLGQRAVPVPGGQPDSEDGNPARGGAPAAGQAQAGDD